HCCVPSFPTRRSSDLEVRARRDAALAQPDRHGATDAGDQRRVVVGEPALLTVVGVATQAAMRDWLGIRARELFAEPPLIVAEESDRKSTRLNSSHVAI